jgi:hypothetical protein
MPRRANRQLAGGVELRRIAATLQALDGVGCWSMAYISPWLTHFVGRQQPTDAARCDLLITILREGCLGQWEQQGNVSIDPGVMLISGNGSLCGNEFIRFKPVCFCDIPEDSLQRHTSIYGRFGLAFNKSFLGAKGANPVFYIANGSIAGEERPQIPRSH